jgi:hypothetical protein
MVKAAALGRKILVASAVAAVLAGALSVARTALEWDLHADSDFTLPAILMLVAAIPEVMVLFGFLHVAKAVDQTSRGPLRLSTIGIFVSFWLMMALTAVVYLAPVPDPTLPAIGAEVYLLLTVGATLALLVVWARGFVGAGVVILAFLVSIYPLAVLLTEKIELGPIMLLTSTLLLFGCLLGFPAWFGATLLRLRPRLGPLAGLLAGVVFANIAVGMILIGVCIHDLFVKWDLEQLRATPKLESELVQAFRKLFLVSIVGEISLALAATVFLLGMRRRLAGRHRW